MTSIIEHVTHTQKSMLFLSTQGKACFFIHTGESMLSMDPEEMKR